MWDKQSIAVLEKAVRERYRRFALERKTDSKNLSVCWNFHLKEIGIAGIRPGGKKATVTLQDVLNVINFRNPEVSDALCIINPDRSGQFLLVPRDVADKIVMLGMP